MCDGEAAEHSIRKGDASPAADCAQQGRRTQVDHGRPISVMRDDVDAARVDDGGVACPELVGRGQPIDVIAEGDGGPRPVLPLERADVERGGALGQPVFRRWRHARRSERPAVVVGHHRKDGLVQIAEAVAVIHPARQAGFGSRPDRRSVAVVVHVHQAEDMAEFVHHDLEGVGPGREVPHVSPRGQAVDSDEIQACGGRGCQRGVACGVEIGAQEEDHVRNREVGDDPRSKRDGRLIAARGLDETVALHGVRRHGAIDDPVEVGEGRARGGEGDLQIDRAARRPLEKLGPVRAEDRGQRVRKGGGGKIRAGDAGGRRRPRRHPGAPIVERRCAQSVAGHSAARLPRWKTRGLPRHPCAPRGFLEAILSIASGARLALRQQRAPIADGWGGDVFRGGSLGLRAVEARVSDLSHP